MRVAFKWGYIEDCSPRATFTNAVGLTARVWNAVTNGEFRLKVLFQAKFMRLKQFALYVDRSVRKQMELRPTFAFVTWRACRVVINQWESGGIDRFVGGGRINWRQLKPFVRGSIWIARVRSLPIGTAFGQRYVSIEFNRRIVALNFQQRKNNEEITK